VVRIDTYDEKGNKLKGIDSFSYTNIDINTGEEFGSNKAIILKDSNTRQAGMIYTRPTIQAEYCENGKHDFICTTEVWCHIRNNRLFYSVNMRSNDFFTGFVNDWAWHYFVYYRLLNALRCNGVNVEVGAIHWHASSFHVYERNFNDIINIYNRYQEELKNAQPHTGKVTNLLTGKFSWYDRNESVYAPVTFLKTHICEKFVDEA
jgi:thymidylate synthase